MQEGAGLYQVTQFWNGPKRGERASAAATYLHPVMDRPNLTVVTRAHATKIVFEAKRAVGVRYRVGRAEHEAVARREVVLSGGAFGSPQLLLLSGVGPADHLAKNGINVVADVPEVGLNLQDHLDYILLRKTRSPDSVGMSLPFIMRAFLACRVVAVTVFARFVMCCLMLVIMSVHSVCFTALVACHWCLYIDAHQAATSFNRQHEKSSAVPEPCQFAVQGLVLFFAVRSVFETNDIHRGTVEFDLQPGAFLSDVEYADAVLVGAVLPLFSSQHRCQDNDQQQQAK